MRWGWGRGEFEERGWGVVTHTSPTLPLIPLHVWGGGSHLDKGAQHLRGAKENNN